MCLVEPLQTLASKKMTQMMVDATIFHLMQSGGDMLTYAWETTVGEERDNSVHVKDGVGEDEFVAMREKRDATLAAPRLLLPSIQVNIRAGRFPEAEDNGVRYLMIPVKAKSEGGKVALTVGGGRRLDPDQRARAASA